MVNMALLVLLFDVIQIILGFDYCLRMPLWLAIRMSDASMWALAACHIRTAEFFVYLFDSCYEL